MRDGDLSAMNEERYQQYCLWCWTRQIEPTDYETWYRVMQGIPEAC